MTIPISQLAGWCAGVGQDFSRRVNDNMRAAAEVGAFTLVEGTPADTGRARSNWNGGINATPAGTDRNPFAPGSNLGRGETLNLQAALTPIFQVLSRARFDVGDVFYVSNTSTYIEDLDNGKSPQGSNFSDAAVISALNLIRSRRFI